MPTGSPTSSTTSVTAPRSSTTTSSTPPTASPSGRCRASVSGPVPATRAACFFGELGSTDRRARRVRATRRTFTVPDLAARRRARASLTSYPRSAFGDLTPELREGEPRGRLRQRLSPPTNRARPGLAGHRGRRPPAAARRGLMGLLVWTRGRDEQYAGLTPGLTPGWARTRASSSAGRTPPSPCSSPRRPESSPGWWAPSSTRRSTSSTSRPPSSTSPCAATSPSRGTTSGVLRADDWVLTRTAPPHAAPPLGPTSRSCSTRCSPPATGSRSPSSRTRSSRRSTPSSGSCTRRPSGAAGSGAALNGSASAGSISARSSSSVSAFLLFFLGAGLSSLFGDAGFRVPPAWVLVGGGVVAGLLVRALGKRMASRTATGSAVLSQSRGLRALHRHGGGQPDPLGGGAGRLQPLPALRHRLRPGRPVGPGLRGGRCRGRGGGPLDRAPVWYGGGGPAASPTSPRAWTRSRPSRRAPSCRPPAPPARAGSAVVAASPVAVAAARPAAAGNPAPDLAGRAR